MELHNSERNIGHCITSPLYRHVILCHINMYRSSSMRENGRLQSLEEPLYIYEVECWQLLDNDVPVEANVKLYFRGPLAPEKLQEYVFSAAEYLSQCFKLLQAILVQALEEANNATKAS